MISAEQLVASIAEETRIIKHLFTKIEPDALDRRPNEHQRSIQELLQYQLRMGTSVVRFLQSGYSPQLAEQLQKETESATLEEFPALMDQQLSVVSEYLLALSEQELDEEVDLFGMGQTMPKRHYIVHVLFKNFVAYRMQLFLYIKMSGQYSLHTMNNWAGMDPQ